jgi:hypothetical protein
VERRFEAQVLVSRQTGTQKDEKYPVTYKRIEGK